MVPEKESTAPTNGAEIRRRQVRDEWMADRRGGMGAGEVNLDDMETEDVEQNSSVGRAVGRYRRGK